MKKNTLLIVLLTFFFSWYCTAQSTSLAYSEDLQAEAISYDVVDFDQIVEDIPMTTFTTDFKYEVCPDTKEPIIITATPQNYSASEVNIVWFRDGIVITGRRGLTLPVRSSGYYEIQVTFKNMGGSSTVGVNVVELVSCDFPQGISPGVSPGLNDTFDLSDFNVSRIEIFNRLGTLVYSKDNYTNEWHGQSNNGNELPVGSYFYTVIYSNGAETRSSWVYISK
ncbi:MAG: gliding motility-associated C-terminal domain-containing protein [Aquaticitalea sp.]